METMVAISAVELSSSAMVSILEREGSRGNSTILRPSWVSSPGLSRAPRVQSWYMEVTLLSCGGGFMKLK